MINVIEKTTRAIYDRMGGSGKINFEALPETIVGHLVPSALTCFEYDKLTPEYDALLEPFVQDLSKHIKRHMTMTRSEIIPLVKEYAEAVMVTMQKTPVRNENAMITIIEEDMPEFINSLEFTDILESYDGHLPSLPESQFLDVSFDDVSPEDLKKILASGLFNEMDRELFEIADTETDQGLLVSKVFKNFFIGSMNRNDNLTNQLDPLKTTYIERSNILSIIFFLSRNPEALVGYAKGSVSAAKVKSFLRQMRDYAGSTLVRLKKNFDASCHSNVLISNRTFADKAYVKTVVYVIGPVYRDFLKTGGSPTHVMASVVTNKNYFSQKEFVTHRNDLESSWRTFSSVTEAHEKNEKFSAFKTSMEIEFIRLLLSKSDAEHDVRSKDTSYDDVVSKLFKEALLNLKREDLMNVYDVCSRIMTEVRFYYTDASLILRWMNEIAKEQPKLDIREVSMIAYSKYIVNFLMSQVRIERN